MPYQLDAAFAGLFRAFTSKLDSIGTLLTDLMKDRSADAPPESNLLHLLIPAGVRI
jgi:hypothetical protein